MSLAPSRPKQDGMAQTATLRPCSVPGTQRLRALSEQLQAPDPAQSISSVCAEACSIVQHMATTVHSGNVSQLSEAVTACFWLAAAPSPLAAQLCAACTQAICAIEPILTQAAEAGACESVALALAPLVHALQHNALPRATDTTWARSIDPSDVATFITCCLSALQRVTTCALAAARGGANSTDHEPDCVSGWATALFELADAGMLTLSQPNVPEELKTLKMVGAAWKEILRLAADLPPHTRQRLIGAFQSGFATAWQHFLVRSRGTCEFAVQVYLCVIR